MSIGERLSEGRGRSLSSVNWFCKEAKYRACSHTKKCSPTALEESLESMFFLNVQKGIFVSCRYMFCHNLGKRPHIQYYCEPWRFPFKIMCEQSTKISFQAG